MPYVRVRQNGCDCALCQADESVWVDEEYEDDEPESEYDDEYDPDPVIHSHGYRPDLTFHGAGPVYLGMELEIEVSDSLYGRSFEQFARQVQDNLGPAFYLQEDGSIWHGFEITTHPMSYEYAIDHIPWDVFGSMADSGAYTRDGTGIHVHVSRAGFCSDCHMYRWMKFVYRNERQVSRLARRRNSEWASFDPSYRQLVKTFIKNTADQNRWSWTRFQAINPTNPDTLEVRVFASSLNPREIKAALAFVASTVEYTRDLDANKIIRERGWAWESYVDWLRSRPVYSPLLDELEALSCVS